MSVTKPWRGGSVDVAVLGAGAAGLGAARRLLARPGLSVLVIEAKARIGGRAHTVEPAGTGFPLDLGCGWLHGGPTNAWTRVARDLGFAVDTTPAPWNEDRDLDLSPNDRQSYSRAIASFYGAVEEAARAGGDVALSAVLPADRRWWGLLDAVSTFVSGAELDRVSVFDVAEYRPGEGDDWRVVAGYGRLVSQAGAGAPVVLDTVVETIDHAGADGIRIETSRGTLVAEAVIVTASTDVLAAETIRFRPALPDKVAAAAALPLGLANKLFLSVADPLAFPLDGYAMGSPDRARTGAYHLRPLGRPMIEAFYGGDLARDHENEGEAGAMAFALDELCGHFGANIRSGLAPLRMTA